jgi:hypothetical protein
MITNTVASRKDTLLSAQNPSQLPRPAMPPAAATLHICILRLPCTPAAAAAFFCILAWLADQLLLLLLPPVFPATLLAGCCCYCCSYCDACADAASCLSSTPAGQQLAAAARTLTVRPVLMLPPLFPCVACWPAAAAAAAAAAGGPATVRPVQMLPPLFPAPLLASCWLLLLLLLLPAHLL